MNDFKRMPKSVIQSPWYNETKFNRGDPWVDQFHVLDENGYDQIPNGNNWSSPKNFEMLADYCRKHLNPSQLLGFIQSTWQPTLEVCRQTHMEAIEQAGRAITNFS